MRGVVAFFDDNVVRIAIGAGSYVKLTKNQLLSILEFFQSSYFIFVIFKTSMVSMDILVCRCSKKPNDFQKKYLISKTYFGPRKANFPEGGEDLLARGGLDGPLAVEEGGVVVRVAWEHYVYYLFDNFWFFY